MNKRIHRQGQQEKVFIHKLMAKNTIDETIGERVLGKEADQQKFIDSIKAMIKNELQNRK
jgi:SNF2 family DNA or RNA helicase